jgi:hypothetical protein
MDSERGTSFEAHPLEARYIKYVADYMGCNFDEIDYNTDKFHKLADLELGKADMRSSDQLREILQKYINNSANMQSLGVYQENLSKFDSLLKNYSSLQ